MYATRTSAKSSTLAKIAPTIRTPPIVGTFALPSACLRRATASVTPVSPIFIERSLAIVRGPSRSTIRNASAAAAKTRNSSSSSKRTMEYSVKSPKRSTLSSRER